MVKQLGLEKINNMGIIILFVLFLILAVLFNKFSLNTLSMISMILIEVPDLCFRDEIIIK